MSNSGSLFGDLLTAILYFVSAIDDFVGSIFYSIGIQSNVQMMFLSVFALIFMFFAFRSFGMVFATIILIMFVLLVVPLALPGIVPGHGNF
ncbi:MAG: hypothetical protein B7Z75_12045 [Acidocella sp. 20-57-95]|nr:MAG: hypothetical protein B7Z75_12045 [Acidocella sp. 20-57-95]OYV59437.1 MAG: hypothetical protein B7Z71_08100 [Acidocella sp. 21-58-7]HQT63196.1 hypothetical protein [Acidocella sp.]HQU04810.1 hypothetical protein [Acidocella sp.]